MRAVSRNVLTTRNPCWGFWGFTLFWFRLLLGGNSFQMNEEGVAFMTVT